MDRQSWNARYSASTVWSGKPNAAVVEHLAELDPGGLALDVGCGEGGDALWLASRGWDVVGVDWAGVALDRARERAAASGMRAQFVEGDATDAAFLASLSPTGHFELVTVAYLHPEPEHRVGSFAHLPGLVAPGGHLLVIAHDPEHGALGLGGPPAHRLLGPDDIVAALALPESFRVLVRGVWRRRHAAHGPDRDAADARDAGDVDALDAVVLVGRHDARRG